MHPQRLVVLEQLEAAQQQLGEIDHALALALLLIGRIQLDELLVEGIVGLDLMRAQALLLGVVDEILQVLRRILLVVDVGRLHHPLDGRELVGLIEDLEALRQPGVAEMGAQHAVAQAVEGADPHRARADRQHGAKTGLHFLGGLVGEGHRQDAGRAHVALLDQPGDARGEHARLAGTRPRQNEGRLVRKGHGGQLFGVQVGEQIGHVGKEFRVKPDYKSCCGAEMAPNLL